jgi:methylated-DNA-[protein]-cysteine S-methyltransferase
MVINMAICFHTAFGFVEIKEKDGAIIRLERLSAPRESYIMQGETKKVSPVLEEAKKQLLAYFDGDLKEFNLPLAPKGTEFQKDVWKALCQVPYGTVISYKELAEMVGRPKAFRAVGGANHNNPIPIIIPCHRVIAADGTLGGYAYGLPMKRRLLALEGLTGL